ncbi:MAG: hypothetical protein IKS42_01180 [Oscillospiraceae bacterium]|nr:hypothetical protein [Oscillospiraceae bacterium]
MLLTLLGVAVAGAVGYNALKDEESRERTGRVLSKTWEVAQGACDHFVQSGIADQRYARGEMSEAEYADYCEKRDRYLNARAKSMAKNNGCNNNDE